MKWIPWRFIVRRMARAQGFLDPVTLLTNLQRFSQPSEVMAPTELLRAGAVLQARGLMNSQAIQHNLDWVWPYWVERQFDPRSISFIPRAFNVTHINLTHRNWTAVGIPDYAELPIVDPRGLVTPLYDGWSLDFWLLKEGEAILIPSRLDSVVQEVAVSPGFTVNTFAKKDSNAISSVVDVFREEKTPVCRIRISAEAAEKSFLVISLRPCNPEGVSFIRSISRLKDGQGWKVNKRNSVFWDTPPDEQNFSKYRDGDVYARLLSGHVFEGEAIDCEVGMATAAAVYRMKANQKKEVTFFVPLVDDQLKEPSFVISAPPPFVDWAESLKGHCELEIPDEKFKFLYDTALRTLILHSPGDVYPGPYTYKRFWFRDAAFILNAMLCVGLADRVEKVLDRFPSRQTPFGYFLSQEGEWDSNGEALWALRRYSEITGRKPKEEWRRSILRAAKWIQRKRLPKTPDSLHAGLLPPGFSAEHLGPNDYYYWDNFWAITGLRSAAYLAGLYGEKNVDEFNRQADDMALSVKKSIEKVSSAMKKPSIPASPYRRMDAGAIGSLAYGYPLLLAEEKDEKLLSTAEFLMNEFFVAGGFFQEISHSGINPYLTLHVAQVLLRAQDERYFDLMRSIADLATSTGQWPEAIHPLTLGGCMGDGQHVWAAAEWILMIRNCFVREENQDRLILASGIPAIWQKNGAILSFGKAPTSFGAVSIYIKFLEDRAEVSWKPEWRIKEPLIEIRLAGYENQTVAPGRLSVTLKKSAS